MLTIFSLYYCILVFLIAAIQHHKYLRHVRLVVVQEQRLMIYQQSGQCLYVLNIF